MDISPANKNPNITKSKADDPVPDRVLDITHEICPMTFVRTRLALDRMLPGQCLLVLLQGEEPLSNVPRSAREQGHAILAETPGADGITRLLIRKAAAAQG